METYIFPYVKYASGNLLYDAGALGHKGWDEVGVGREGHEGGEIYMPMADSC